MMAVPQYDVMKNVVEDIMARHVPGVEKVSPRMRMLYYSSLLGKLRQG